MPMNSEESQITFFDPDFSFGKMSPAHSPVQTVRTSGRSLRKLSELRTAPVMCLDLTREHGNLLGQSYWQINSVWLGECWTLNTGVSPSVGVESSLSRILEAEPHPKYYLSRTACLGILRRAEARGKELPPQLKDALLIQAGKI